MYDNTFIQQGWECPKCKRVYAPSTPMCWYCPVPTSTSTDVPVNVPVNGVPVGVGGTGVTNININRTPVSVGGTVNPINFTPTNKNEFLD